MFVFTERINAVSTQWFRRKRKCKKQTALNRPITGQVHNCHALLSKLRLLQLTLMNFNTRSKNKSSTNKTQPVQLCLKVISYFLSRRKKYVTLGMQAVMKIQKKIKIGIPEIGKLSLITSKVLWIMSKTWAFIQHQKSTTSGWALGMKMQWVHEIFETLARCRFTNRLISRHSHASGKDAGS